MIVLEAVALYVIGTFIGGAIVVIIMSAF